MGDRAGHGLDFDPYTVDRQTNSNTRRPAQQVNQASTSVNQPGVPVQGGTGSAQHGGNAGIAALLANRGVELFPPAAQPDIVRSSLKDEYHSSQLSDAVIDVAGRVLGNTVTSRYREEMTVLSRLLYYTCTTLTGQQTLGEEYSNMLQVHSAPPRGLSLFRRICLVLTEVVAGPVMERVTLRVSRILRTQPCPEQVPEYIWDGLARVLQYARQNVHVIPRLHLAVFYLYGEYYSLAKRVLGVRYIFNQRTVGHRPRYPVLGVLILAQMGMTIALAIRGRIAQLVSPPMKLQSDTTPARDSQSQEQQNVTAPAGKCALCLSDRDDTTATPCGHLFCWECISEWATTKTECPLCRQAFRPQQLYPVANYR